MSDRASAGEHRPVVTLAALYGAGGSIVGARVAERLGVPFLDREIPEAVEPQTGRERLTAGLGRLSTITGGAGGTHEGLHAQESDMRSRIEGFLADASRTGGVALGRGGMVVLRSVPWALHVLLAGPSESRVAQSMALEGIDRATARDRLRTEDGTRTSYVRRAYGVDGEDPAWYHVVLDSTALELDICVDLVVSAAVARTRVPRSSPPI